MNIGKDAMGTMANTLILAFAGSSLNTLLLARVYDIPFAQLINTDFICVEILQSVAGSMGILLTVPLVTAVSAKLMTADGFSIVRNTPENLKRRKEGMCMHANRHTGASGGWRGSWLWCCAWACSQGQRWRRRRLARIKK